MTDLNGKMVRWGSYPDVKTKVVERKLESGETEYGVQYSDGHIKWFSSLPHAYYALSKNLNKKKNRKRQV